MFSCLAGWSVRASSSRRARNTAHSSSGLMQAAHMDPAFVADEGVSLTFGSSFYATRTAARPAARPAEHNNNQEQAVQQETPAAESGLLPHQMQMIVWVPQGRETTTEAQEALTDEEEEEEELPALVDVPDDLQEAPIDGMLRSLRSAPYPHILRLPAPLVSQVLQEEAEPKPMATAAQDDDSDTIELSFEDTKGAIITRDDINEAQLFYSSPKQQMTWLGEDFNLLMGTAQQVLAQNQQLHQDLQQSQQDVQDKQQQLEQKNVTIGLSNDLIELMQQNYNQLQQNYDQLQQTFTDVLQMGANAEAARDAALQDATMGTALLAVERRFTAVLQERLAQMERRSSDSSCCLCWASRCSALSREDSGCVADAAVFVRVADAASSSKGAAGANGSSDDGSEEGDACAAVVEANVDV